jgi:hypothetical protein
MVLYLSFFDSTEVIQLTIDMPHKKCCKVDAEVLYRQEKRMQFTTPSMFVYSWYFLNYDKVSIYLHQFDENGTCLETLGCHVGTSSTLNSDYTDIIFDQKYQKIKFGNAKYPVNEFFNKGIECPWSFLAIKATFVNKV